MSDENVAAEAVEVVEEESTEIQEEEVQAEGEESSDVATEVEATEEEITEEEKEQVEEVIRKLTLKVDGEEMEEELPFDVTPEMAEYLQKKLQLAAVSNKRMQESAELKKQEIERNAELENFMQVLQSNPEIILEQMGMDTKEFAEKILTKEVELMEMSPEERKILELQTELEKIQKDNEVKQKEAEDIRLEGMRNQYAAEFERDLTDAIENSDLPNNPEIINRMTGMMRVAIENEIDLSFKDLVPVVKDELQTDLNSIIGSMPDDVIKSLIGDERLAKFIPKKVVAKEAPPTSSSIEQTGKKTDKEESKLRSKNINDFFRSL